MNAPIEPLLTSAADAPPAAAAPALLRMAQVLRHGVALLDAGNCIVWTNPAWSDLTGYAAEEVRAARLDDVLGWDAFSGSVAATLLRSALQARASSQQVMPLRRPDGSRFWAQVELHWLGEQPETGQWAVTLVDLSGHAIGSDQLRQMIDGAAAPMIVWDEGGVAVQANLSAQVLFGVSPQALLGRSIDDCPWRCTDADGQPLEADWLPEVVSLQTGRPVQDFTLGVMLPDGRNRWLLVHTQALARGEGESPWVVAHYQDITEQHNRKNDLDRQWRRLLSALEGSRISTWEWNLDTGELHFDDRAAEIIGRSPEAMWPPTIDVWRAVIHPDDAATAEMHLKAHFDGETAYYEQELRLAHADGSWRWVRDRGRLSSHTADGRPEWMYGTREDITQRKTAELAAARDHALLQALFDLSPIGIELVDLTMEQPLLVNRALQHIVGQPATVLLDPASGERVCPRWLDRRRQWFSEVVLNDHFGPTEAQITRGDGRAVSVVANGVRVNVASRDHLWLTVQDVTDARAMERELRAAASQDRLTGLANRASLLRELHALSERAQQDPQQGFAVYFLDFDRFKLVNDTLGHEAGDELLRGIAQRLREACEAVGARDERLPWMASRLGGDEFVLVAPGIATREQAMADAEGVLQVLAAPYQVKQQPFHSSASIGVALWSEAVGDGDALLRNADIAMYEAKRLGRRRAIFFDEQMHDRITRSVRIEAALRDALALGQLHLVYQPIVDLESGRMTSAEALLRWRHPVLGPLSPAEFIPIAEESGLIVEIGEWALHEACRQWAAWQRDNIARAPASISVNLSRVQVSMGDRLIEAVRSALQRSEVPAAALQLELTEREVMRDQSGTRDLMLRLRALGVRLAMDDFGTGVSSLGSLRALPFDVIKIDKSFITDLCRDPQAMTVAHATVSVIENLGMASVAEGIEDAAEVAALQAMGCRFGQGYLFARPMPADQMLGAWQDAAPAR